MIRTINLTQSLFCVKTIYIDDIFDPPHKRKKQREEMCDQGRNWRMGRVGNCPLSFWQNIRRRRTAAVCCITTCPPSFKDRICILFFVIVTVIVTVIVPYAMFILLL